jgi:ribonuclease PH
MPTQVSLLPSCVYLRGLPECGPSPRSCMKTNPTHGNVEHQRHAINTHSVRPHTGPTVTDHFPSWVIITAGHTQNLHTHSHNLSRERMENCVPFQLVKRRSPGTTGANSAKSTSSSSSSSSNASAGQGFGCEFNIVSYRNGSVLLTMGKTKVLCTVTLRAAPQFSPVAVLRCDVKYTAFSGILANVSHCGGFGNTQQNSLVSTLELFVAQQVQQAIEPSLRLELYPKMLIYVKFCILETAPTSAVADDCYNYDLSACVCAASLALVSARVEMIDIVSACTLHYGIDKQNDAIAKSTPSTVTVCSMTKIGQQTHLLIDGRATSEMMIRYQNHCIDGCRTARTAMDKILHQMLTLEEQNRV